MQTKNAATKPAGPLHDKPNRKSKAKLFAVCAAAGLVLVGVFLYAFFFDGFSRSSTKTDVAAENRTNQKTTHPAQNESRSAEDTNRSSDSQTPTAAEIVQRVIERYDSLTNYSASGKAVSILDMSGIDPEIAVTNSEEIKKAISKPQRTENSFSLKLGKPGLYRVEWEGMMGPINRKGAVWSNGNGNFLLMDMDKIKYAQIQTRELALATATGISGGIANTIPEIFFKGQSSLLNLFKNPTRGEDESIGGEDCYVVMGSAMGFKVLLWINKSNFLIKQKQQVLGGNLEIPEMSEADMEKSLKQLGSKQTEEQKAKMIESMRNMKAMTSKIKGTITETYENIKINQPFTPADFNYSVPAGTKLSASLF